MSDEPARINGGPARIGDTPEAVVDPGLGSVHARVAAILSRYAQAETTLRPQTELVRDLGIDSVTAMDIVMEIEDAYAFDVPLAEIGAIRTVQDLVDLVARHAPDS